jgi:hypothetical protein
MTASVPLLIRRRSFYQQSAIIRKPTNGPSHKLNHMLDTIRTLLNEEEVDHQSLVQVTLAEGETMYAFQTSGSKAVAYWQRLKDALATTEKDLAFVAVLLGTEQSFELTMEHLGSLAPLSLEFREDEEEPSVMRAEPTTAELVEMGEKIDCQNWLAERLERFVCPPGEWPVTMKVGLVSEPEPFNTDDQPMSINYWDNNLDRLVVGERIYMALVPTSVSYKIPVLMRFGGENSCPKAQEHYAMLKRWHELHGASILAIEPNVIECFVEKPPMNKEQALKIAREHYGYSNDTIDQGEGEIAAYAYELLNKKLWTFWWD